MPNGRPELREFLAVVEVSACGRIVDQRIEPDVDDVLVVTGNGNPPFQRRSRDRLVAHARTEETHDLVVAAPGKDRLRIRLIVRQKLVGVLRGAEEVALLLHLNERTSAIGTGPVLPHAALGNVRLARDAVPSLVGALVDISLIHEFLEHALDDAFVTFFRRPDKVVVGDPEHRPQISEVQHGLVGQFLGRHAFGFRALLYFLAVFVRAGQEKDVVAAHAHMPAHDVRGDCGIGMADMRNVIHIINRRGEIEVFLRHVRSPPCSCETGVELFVVSGYLPVLFSEKRYSLTRFFGTPYN